MNLESVWRNLAFWNSRGAGLPEASTAGAPAAGPSADRLDMLLQFACSSLRAEGGSLFHYEETETGQGTVSRRLVCDGCRGDLELDASDPETSVLAQLLLARAVESGRRILICHPENRVEKLLLDAWKTPQLVATVIRIRDRSGGLLLLSFPARRALGAEDLNFLDFLAQQASLSLQHDRVYNLMLEQTRLVREFDIAAHLQQELLPDASAHLAGLDVNASMNAAREVGGDYYDFLPLPDGGSLVVIGDVAGKGLPAGMIMLILRTLLHVLVDLQPEISPSRLVAQLNARLAPQLDLMTYVTFLCLRWDAASRRFHWCGAGHEHLLIWHAAARRSERIRAGGMALGLMREPGGLWEEHELALAAGDAVLLYTDGVTEARRGEEDAYGLDRLQASLERHADLPAEALLAAVQADLQEHTGRKPAEDDQTLLVMKVV